MISPRLRNLLSVIPATIAVLAIFAAVAYAATIDGEGQLRESRGTNQNDTINANGGDDKVNARKSADIVNGGLGNDLIFAGLGNDTVDGGDGRRQAARRPRRRHAERRRRRRHDLRRLSESTSPTAATATTGSGLWPAPTHARPASTRSTAATATTSSAPATAKPT